MLLPYERSLLPAQVVENRHSRRIFGPDEMSQNHRHLGLNRRP
jgi:hypothetical protein